MKKILLFALVAVAVAHGFLYRQQTRETAAKEAEAAAVKRELAEAEAEVEKREQRNQAEQARLSAANAQLAEKVARVARSEPASTTNPPTQGTSADAAKPKHSMAEMLRDPDMREVFRKQARASVARGVKELVSSHLVQQLGLTKEQTVELKKLLTQKGTRGFDFMMPVMTGELDEAGLAEFGRKTKADMAAITDELKALLGDEGYKTFEAHEKTQPDRDRVEKFTARLKETGQVLSPDQRDQLLAAMAEERSNFKFAVDYNDASQIDYEHFHAFYSEDKMNAYFQEMEQLNDCILQRAQSILSAEQVAELQEVLRFQLQKGKYVVKSTNAMLGKNAGR